MVLLRTIPDIRYGLSPSPFGTLRPSVAAYAENVRQKHASFRLFKEIFLFLNFVYDFNLIKRKQ